MRTNYRQIAANATTHPGLQVIVRTIDATLRHLDALLMGLKRGMCHWYAQVPAPVVVRPVVAAEQKCSQRHQTRRPDGRSCSSFRDRDGSSNVSTS